jgi:hypothetical protein
VAGGSTRVIMSAFALMILTASAKPDTVSQCAPLEGADRVLSQSRTKWLIVGEVHGTNEAPEMFGDLLCHAGQTQRPLVVGIEFPDSDQTGIDAFLASDGGADALAALLALPSWHQPLQDGRTSAAMFGLFERLRKMVAAKIVSQVVAFVPTTGVRGGEYERQMAQLLMAAQKPHNALVLALVGNAHARRVPFRASTPYRPMASWLPKKNTSVFDMGHNAGASWNCTGASFKELVCASKDDSQAHDGSKRGIAVRQDLESGRSGVMNFGKRSTASPPAIGSNPPPIDESAGPG